MMNFICEYILPVILLFLVILATILIVEMTISIYKTDILNQDSYIQNLEEKLNIYEEDYDKFCLKDSLRQVQ